jgi:hypothetical protein
MTTAQSNDLLSLGFLDEGEEEVEEVYVSDDIGLKQLRADSL